MNHQLLRGDCLTVMKTLPDRSVDCFLCDLPYGQLHSGWHATPVPNLKQEGTTIPAGDCSWDIKLDLTEFWVQVKRLCRNEHTPVLMFCNTKFGIDLINSNPSWFRHDLVWDKTRGGSFLNANRQPMRSHEMVYVFSKRAASYTRTSAERCDLTVVQFPRVSRGSHPTEKPVALLKWLLERYCPPNGTVLDPTAGSFNTVLAAHELGLTGIGIEMNEGFYNAAVDRLSPILAGEEEV